MQNLNSIEFHEYRKDIDPQTFSYLNGITLDGPNNHFSWLEVFKDYWLYDRRVVNVFRLENNKIVMEKLDGFTLNNKDEVNKLDVKTKRYIINEVFDIYNKQWNFKSQYIKDDEIWCHRDFKLANLMYVKGKVRLLDPEAFRITNLAPTKNMMHYGKFFETYIKLMCMMENSS